LPAWRSKSRQRRLSMVVARQARRNRDATIQSRIFGGAEAHPALLSSGPCGNNLGSGRWLWDLFRPLEPVGLAQSNLLAAFALSMTLHLYLSHSLYVFYVSFCHPASLMSLSLSVSNNPLSAIYQRRFLSHFYLLRLLLSIAAAYVSVAYAFSGLSCGFCLLDAAPLYLWPSLALPSLPSGCLWRCGLNNMRHPILHLG